MVNPPIPSQLYTEYTSKPENITKATSDFFNRSISGVTEPTIFLPKSVGRRIISSIFKNTRKTDSKKLSEFVITRPERALKNMVAPNESIRITRNKNTYLKQLGYSKAEVKDLSKQLDKAKANHGEEEFMTLINAIPSKKDKDLGYENKGQAMMSLNMAFTSLKSSGYSKEDAIRTIASIKNNASSRNDFSEAIGQASSAGKHKIQQDLEHKRLDIPPDPIKKLGYKSNIKFLTTFKKAVKIAVDLGYETKDAENLLEKAQKEMPVKDFRSYARNLLPLNQFDRDYELKEEVNRAIK